MSKTFERSLTVGLAAALCLLLTGCGDKVEPPEAYVIGENSTVPLDSFLDEEEGGKLTAIETPESEDEDEKDGKDKKDSDDEEKDEKDEKSKKDKKSKDKKSDKDEESKKDDGDDDAKQLSESTEGEEEEGGEAGESADVYTYTYEEVPAAALDRYAAALVAEEEGFRVIDEERAPQTDLPAFDEESGAAVFAREAVEADTLFQIAIDWTEKECVVKVSCEPGGFYSEEEEAAVEEEEVLTLEQTLSFVRGLSPSDLGLEGESMAEYILLPVGGNPLVDGAICRHINVYKEDPEAGTNVVQGTYLVGTRTVYLLDPIEHTVEQVYPK